MKKHLGLILFLIPVLAFTQTEKKFGIEFHGFVKNDIFYDSRQTVDARDGHFLLYPSNEKLDFNGDDVNATPNFNILSIQSRLTGKISGPDALGAKTSGVIEGAFFGNIGSDINGFRLRHAFIKLSWDHAELLAGQFWHPLFVTSNFPGTVSFNTGTPFQPFSRNPQIRFTYKAGGVKLIASAMEQVDFKDGGPGNASTKYIRNAAIPELNLRLEYKSEGFLIGAGANYKTLKPRTFVENAAFTHEFNDSLYTIEKSVFKTNNSAKGISLFFYGHVKKGNMKLKLYGIKGQMLYGMTNLGGYAESGAVSELVNVSYADGSSFDVNQITDYNYTPINTNSVWADFIYNISDNVDLGIFGGLTQNKGANDTITGEKYSRGGDIAYVYRVSPRIVYNANKFRVAPEIEYTVASYGSADDMGIVNNGKEISNLRFLIGLYYFF